MVKYLNYATMSNDILFYSQLSYNFQLLRSHMFRLSVVAIIRELYYTSSVSSSLSVNAIHIYNMYVYVYMLSMFTIYWEAKRYAVYVFIIL